MKVREIGEVVDLLHKDTSKVKITLETSGEDLKVHSKRVEKM